MRLKLNQSWANRNNGLRLLLTIALIVYIALQAADPSQTYSQPIEQKPSNTLWGVQSIDTVKYSRDLSREKLLDPTFDEVIDAQVALIAKTGATHVAIGTPYDKEFWPMIERWVAAARRNNLSVWFRGNWSGWEGWFGYAPINRSEHQRLTDKLIREHKNWFQDGDIFTACPECENGGPGDPRQTGDVKGHRQFLIKEHQITERAFKAIGKKVTSNYNSMNGDVARLVMDRDTTVALGGIVTVDHYVRDSAKLVQDLNDLAASSGGKIVLGEFGAPIPDIHGRMSEAQQAKWIKNTLTELSHGPNIIGVNYWSAVGGSTELWNSGGKPKAAVSEIKQFYQPEMLTGVVVNELSERLAGVAVTDGMRHTVTNNSGQWWLPVPPNQTKSLVTFQAKSYSPSEAWVAVGGEESLLTLIKPDKDLAFRLMYFFVNLINSGTS